MQRRFEPSISLNELEDFGKVAKALNIKQKAIGLKGLYAEIAKCCTAGKTSVCAQHPTRDAPVDICVAVNRHFPPAELLEEIRDSLPSLPKYYPVYADVHQQL